MKKLLSIFFLTFTALTGIAQQTRGTIHIYRNDSEMNTFFRDEVKSLSFSRMDDAGQQYDNIVTQIVETVDSTHYIPLVAIDSICFVMSEIEKKEKYSITRLFRLEDFNIAPFSSSAQGMDVYNDRILFQAGLAGNLIHIIDLESKVCLGSITFSSPNGESSHMNNINLGEKYVNTDIYPLLYVSQTTNSHACFVIRLSNNNASYDVIQTIKYVGKGHHAGSNYDWFIDLENQFIYTYGKHDGILEEREILKFPLPPLKIKGVTYTDEDVIDSFILKDMSIYQGSRIINGLLYAPVGFGNDEYPGRLIITNLEEKRIVAALDINCGEPESIGQYKDGAIICGGGTNPFYFFIQL